MKQVSVLLISLAIVLLISHEILSWNVEEWGNPFEDVKFQKLNKDCRFGYDQYDCPKDASCFGSPRGFCRCPKGYVNPDLPGTASNEPRCLSEQEFKVEDNDPRWRITITPCAADCAKRNATCPENGSDCVCKEGYIVDQRTQKLCKTRPSSESSVIRALPLSTILFLTTLAFKWA